ncbi:hypothetical protein A3B55_02570 [Candidatus Daviesbacteria bacterium RIFCSPLOWO2_01_FULL_43_15]|nr:MAG: hypothetical protein A3B55_02570 [Candidatus Daviesbacteria bacterium RIFCSPLOWO2_01_FULL_43_15]
MKTITIPATELKRNTAEILNIVAYGNTVAIIERYGEAVAKVVPVVGRMRSKEEIKAVLDKYFGAIPDFPDVTKLRVSRRRPVNLDE